MDSPRASPAWPTRPASLPRFLARGGGLGGGTRLDFSKALTRLPRCSCRRVRASHWEPALGRGYGAGWTAGPRGPWSRADGRLAAGF